MKDVCDFNRDKRVRALERSQPLNLKKYEKWVLAYATAASACAGYLMTNDGLGTIIGAALPGAAYLAKKAFF
jgi:hypothetical protein